MTYSKTFPRTIEGSNFPKWEEIYLTEEEEGNSELEVRKQNIEIMKECIFDAHQILRERNLDFSHSDVIKTAISLFEKRASHAIHIKEQKAKEKFDLKFKKE